MAPLLLQAGREGGRQRAEPAAVCQPWSCELLSSLPPSSEVSRAALQLHTKPLAMASEEQMAYFPLQMWDAKDLLGGKLKRMQLEDIRHGHRLADPTCSPINHGSQQPSRTTRSFCALGLLLSPPCMERHNHLLGSRHSFNANTCNQRRLQNGDSCRPGPLNSTFVGGNVQRCAVGLSRAVLLGIVCDTLHPSELS